MKKKILSFVMAATLMITGLAPYASAANYEEQKIESVIVNIQERYPDATIIRGEDGSIHIVMEKSYSEKMTRASSAEQIYAPEGGTYSPIIAPWYYGTSFPVSKMYLPINQTEALVNARLIDGLLDDVKDLAKGPITNAVVTKIIQTIAAKYGVQLSRIGVMFLISLPLVISWMNDMALALAVKNSPSGKIVIVSCMEDGILATYYWGWDSDYVSLSPWDDCTGTFEKGAFNF